MFNLLKKKKPRMFVIGLDCAPPELLYDQWRHELPNLNRLFTHGAYGRMESCKPCITVPAWSVMTSSKDPGTLGIYGFRNRADHSYDRLTIATGAAVKEPRVWEILSEAGKKVITVGIPGSYPPRKVNGLMAGCFLTPGTVGTDEYGRRVDKTFTYPPEYSAKFNQWAGGEYLVDIPRFRTDDKDDLLEQMYTMTRQHFEVLRQLLKTEADWDFFMFVEMGTDRIHHGFWKFHDPTHNKFEPGNKYEQAIHDYYKYLDGEIGSVLELLDDGTAVMVVSDHGVKKMDGGICINQWLIGEGLLTLRDDLPTRITPMEKVEIDWPNTRVWGEGGYYARVYMNVKGREPQGVIEPADYERFRDGLAERIRVIPDDQGNPLPTLVYKPEAIYQRVNRIPPDLMVYFGDLHWRSVGSLGHPRVWTFENDTGPDDANHGQMGVLSYYHPKKTLGGKHIADVEIMDFAPTVLDYFGLSVPADMQGRVINFEG